MITFFICLAILIIGYFVYGRVVEGLFHPDDKPTPAVLHPDGVDYVPMKEWKAYRRSRTYIRSFGRCALGSCSVPLDRFGNSIRRCCARLCERYAVNQK